MLWRAFFMRIYKKVVLSLLNLFVVQKGFQTNVQSLTQANADNLAPTKQLDTYLLYLSIYARTI